MAGNIVVEWLRSLHLGQYSESFIDNGYDDLEICKQVGDPDLDAIGVFNPVHRGRLLQSVRTLREEGAASVYFTLEESVAIHEECYCDNVSVRSSRTSSGRSEKEVSVTTNRVTISPEASSSVESGQEVKYFDEYEEGKAELVKIPRMQLKMLLWEKLSQDGIRLNCQPYSTSDGERGYLEGLASRYADLFNTHYGDVLGHLEDLRKTIPKESIAITPETPFSDYIQGGDTPVVTGHGLTSSQSQPIYAPGKYSPSSCLSDKEEDEIYGFGYGVFGAQIARQQQKLGHPPMSHQLPSLPQNYQTCLTSRSAYCYEFPPNEQNYTNTKKRTFARFLRGFKVSHRKEKHGASSPRHGRAAVRDVPQRVDTPDSVLQSGLGLMDLGQHAVIRSIVDPRDYERLRQIQMNGGTPNTFEETIYKLKLQEALRKREKFTKEHEEILKDIKQGLQQLGEDGAKKPCLTGDDTYMYDEDACMLTPSAQNHDRGHWYDEPPYESDPEDFLMGSSPGPTATIQNGRVCFTLNLRQEQLCERVISLRSAGDISVPREGGSRISSRIAQPCLILPQVGYPPTIIPLRSLGDRESGDYAGSDVRSICSRLSTFSVDTSRSDQVELGKISSQLEDKIKHLKKSAYIKDEEGLSPSQSSDYEDQEANNKRPATVSAIVGKVKGFREDVQRKLSRIKYSTVEQQNTFEQIIPCSASSIESLPSGSESSTRALVRDNSTHSSMSTEDPDSAHQVLAKARALKDHIPCPHDKESLKFKAGDIIDIISMNASGQWTGICHGKTGSFKFINVELLSKRSDNITKELKWHSNVKGRPSSVEDLLQKINLQEYISVFVLNGYEDLELFREIEPSDLDYLGIVNTDHRAKILTCVQFLHDLDSSSERDLAGSSSESDELQRGLLGESDDSPLGTQNFLSHSVCHDASVKESQQNQVSSQETSDSPAFSDKNNLDFIVEQCNNEILSKMRQTLKNSIDFKGLPYQPNIPDMSGSTFDTEDLKMKQKLNDSSRRDVLIQSGTRKSSEETHEVNQKLVTDLGLNETSTVILLGRSCLSEKSSDSGISSSSLSSANTKECRPVLSHCFMDNPGSSNMNFYNYCANTSTTAYKEKTFH